MIFNWGNKSLKLKEKERVTLHDWAMEKEASAANGEAQKDPKEHKKDVPSFCSSFMLLFWIRLEEVSSKPRFSAAADQFSGDMWSPIYWRFTTERGNQSIRIRGSPIIHFDFCRALR